MLRRKRRAQTKVGASKTKREKKASIKSKGKESGRGGRQLSILESLDHQGGEVRRGARMPLPTTPAEDARHERNRRRSRSRSPTLSEHVHKKPRRARDVIDSELLAQVMHRSRARKFVLSFAEGEAFCEYVKHDDRVEIWHTLVPKQLQGQVCRKYLGC